jgi:hypothetical protein
MTAVLEIAGKRDIRDVPAYIKELKNTGKLPSEVEVVSLLGNSDTPDDPNTVDFYQRRAKHAGCTEVVVVHGVGINIDNTPNNLSTFFGIKN